MSTAEHEPITREELERLYAQLLSVLPALARVLNKPSPIVSRAERRAARLDTRAILSTEREDWSAR